MSQCTDSHGRPEQCMYNVHVAEKKMRPNEKIQHMAIIRGSKSGSMEGSREQRQRLEAGMKKPAAPECPVCLFNWSLTSLEP